MSSIPVPQDILINILLRLPFESISLCRCVCKLWYTLLSDPSFVKTHYDLAVDKNYILLKCYDVHNKIIIYSMNYDSLASSSLSASEFDNRIEMLRYPFESEGYQVDILGSSNGLICMLAAECLYESTICIIWNPTTKEYRRLPESPNKFPCEVNEYMTAYGFCYDCKIDDYKLIKAAGFVGDSTNSGVQVYNLGANSWKNAHEILIPYYFPCNSRCSGIIVHGSLHWIGKPGVESYSQERPDVIVSFDICDEKFDVLAFPAAVENDDVIKELGEIDGCLCLLIQDPNCSVQLWVMREYGVRESWSILFATSHQLLVNRQIRSKFLVYSFQNGDVLLANSNSFILYRPRRDRAITMMIPGIRGSGDVERYSKSLFSLNSRTYVGQDDRIDQDSP